MHNWNTAAWLKSLCTQLYPPPPPLALALIVPRLFHGKKSAWEWHYSSILKENKGRGDGIFIRNTKQTAYIVIHDSTLPSHDKVLCHFANYTPHANFQLAHQTHLINVATLITLTQLCMSTCSSSTPQPSAYIPCHTGQLISAMLSSNKIAAVQCTSACKH